MNLSSTYGLVGLTQELSSKLAVLQDIDEEDEAAFERFMPQGDGKMRNLADIIQDKINERQTELSTKLSGMIFYSKDYFFDKKTSDCGCSYAYIPYVYR